MTIGDDEDGYTEGHEGLEGQEEGAQGRVSGRRGLTDGPEWPDDVREREGDVPDAVDRDGLQPHPDERRDASSINAVIQAQLSFLEEHHVHLPTPMPDQGWLERARAETPEVYNAYVQGMKDSFKTDNIVRREEAREPRQVTIGGQVTALIGLSLVLALAGYLAFLGYPVTAGIVAALDLVGIIAAFASQRPNQPYWAPRGQANNNEGEDAESTRRIAETTAGAAVVCSYCCTTRASSPPPAKVNVHVRPLVIGLPVQLFAIGGRAPRNMLRAWQLDLVVRPRATSLVESPMRGLESEPWNANSFLPALSCSP